MKIPNTVDLNTVKAYVDLEKSHPPAQSCGPGDAKLNALDLQWNRGEPESLRVLSLRGIADGWWHRPVYAEIPAVEDRNFLLDLLDVRLPIAVLAQHIHEDVFWRRSFQVRWRNYYPAVVGTRRWISIYMERHLAEHLEALRPADWHEESMRTTWLQVCAEYVEELCIGQLRPAMDEEENDHIRMDVVLGGLPRLQRLEMSYTLKNIGTEFYLGCANVTARDVKWLTLGLEKCRELVEFRTRLDPDHLRSLAASLSGSCTNLETLSLAHCWISDDGLIRFIRQLSADAFRNLRHLELSDNHITQKSAEYLADVIQKRPLESLNLRLNPIGSTGAASILAALGRTQIQVLNLGGCSVDASIGELIMYVLVTNKFLKTFILCANHLGEDFGAQLAGLTFARQLQEFDLRSTNISPVDQCRIDSAILENRMKYLHDL